MPYLVKTVSVLTAMHTHTHTTCVLAAGCEGQSCPKPLEEEDRLLEPFLKEDNASLNLLQAHKGTKIQGEDQWWKIEGGHNPEMWKGRPKRQVMQECYKNNGVGSGRVMAVKAGLIMKCLSNPDCFWQDFGWMDFGRTSKFGRRRDVRDVCMPVFDLEPMTQLKYIGPACQALREKCHGEGCLAEDSVVFKQVIRKVAQHCHIASKVGGPILQECDCLHFVEEQWTKKCEGIVKPGQERSGGTCHRNPDCQWKNYKCIPDKE